MCIVRSLLPNAVRSPAAHQARDSRRRGLGRHAGAQCWENVGGTREGWGWFPGERWGWGERGPGAADGGCVRSGSEGAACSPDALTSRAARLWSDGTRVPRSLEHGRPRPDGSGGPSPVAAPDHVQTRRCVSRGLKTQFTKVISHHRARLLGTRAISCRGVSRLERLWPCRPPHGHRVCAPRGPCSCPRAGSSSQSRTGREACGPLRMGARHGVGRRCGCPGLPGDATGLFPSGWAGREGRAVAHCSRSRQALINVQAD